MVEQFTFYFFAALAVISAVLVVTVRNAVYSAVFLITTLLATAGIFLQLRAEFLFVVQIILYVGGIMVLFVFVVMLVDLDVALRQVQFNRQKWVALLVVLAVAGQLVFALALGSEALGLPAAAPESLEPNTESVGLRLFESYMLPFEIASILLLVAMIGAVLLGKRQKPPRSEA
ncbi:MAG: NADH-quinone oxidoreductase subunit J [Acidobacteriia bacterium]|jgi:NADH-quinone oxidoreductase subunit J|nr:NADH-quinone oxidoreductase subunit J [Terriglobia bacterium]